jgi:hypothetical protein
MVLEQGGWDPGRDQDETMSNCSSQQRTETREHERFCQGEHQRCGDTGSSGF